MIKKVLFNKYYRSILEIFTSSERSVIVRSTSGGLYNPNTPTNDYIDNLPEVYNPLNDLGDY